MRRLRLLVLELKAAATASTAASRENIFEDVLEASEAAAARPATRALKAARPEAEGLEHALAAEAAAGAAGTKAFETLEARLALGVDLAAVERLALLDVARISWAALSSAKRLAALGSCLLASGWSFLASFRNALLMSAALALLDTPSTS